MFAGFSIDFHDFPVIVALNMNQTVSDDIDEEIHNCFLYQNIVKSLNKILPLVLVLSISLIMGNQMPDAFGAKPTTVTLERTDALGGTITVHVEDKDDSTHPTDPCGDGTPAAPCTTPVEVIGGQSFIVSGAFESETHFYLGTTSGDPEFFFDNKGKGTPPLHTSCSAPLVGSIGTVIATGETLTVTAQTGGSGSGCPEDIVGGHGGPIDKTALMVTGAQLSASWMIPLLVSAIGIGVFVVTRKS